MIKNKFLTGLFVLMVFASVGFIAQVQSAPVQGVAEKPLLMAGKQTLFQRVLVRPNSRLYDKAGEPQKSHKATPFTVFYVYERQLIKDKEWLRVGADSHGSVSGWLKASQSIEWTQALTVSFREAKKHDRIMLFKDRESLKRLVDASDLEEYKRLYQNASAGKIVKNSPVIAIQPAAHIDIKENFYLVPIKQHEDVFLGSSQARILQVSSVPLASAVKAKNPSSKKRQKSFRSGLMFVVDSTSSMESYIDRTREAVKTIYTAIKKEGLTDKVNFGLTAYRDNTKSVPGLQYLVKTSIGLEQGATAESFLNKVNSVKASSVSSRDFVEDAYSGIKQAIDKESWENFDARYIVLITDAGARDSNDPLSGTGLDANQIRQLAQDKGISIWVLHLLTEEGAENHVEATHQYQRVSYYPGIGSFYYGVQMGKVEEFGRVLEALTLQITEQVKATTQGLPPLDVPASPTERTKLSAFQDRVAKLGHALRMQYLSKNEKGELPQVFDAWLVDRDFHDPEYSGLDVRVLLTRNQLSDLQYVLRQVLETAEEGVLSPKNFLDDLKSLAATLSRDPSSVSSSTRAAGAAANLADMGYMREYIEDLPYVGEVMSVSLEDWEDWSAKHQLEFVHRLENKINYYEALHDHTDLWVSLDGGSINGDSVYPVLLDMLP
ncbi:MAG: VWA domain-containing protein [Gammaproteobacteria bacterium]|nr:VWA domain-containing protein [Gammaproteobacteria bacterium]